MPKTTSSNSPPLGQPGHDAALMDALSQLSSALKLFGTGLSQRARLVMIVTAQASGMPETLMMEQFTGREAVSELFRFDVDALSTHQPGFWLEMSLD